MEEEYLTAEDVAVALQVNLETVRRLVRRGEIVGFKFGGQWRFRNDAIMDYIRRREREQEDND